MRPLQLNSRTDIQNTHCRKTKDKNQKASTQCTMMMLFSSTTTTRKSSAATTTTTTTKTIGEKVPRASQREFAQNPCEQPNQRQQERSCQASSQKANN